MSDDFEIRGYPSGKVFIRDDRPEKWVSPTGARRLANRLLAAADEAESEPRFSESDVLAIEAKLFDMGLGLSLGAANELRSLRKKRGES